MKLSQTLFLVIVVNLLMSVVSLSLHHGDANKFITTFEDVVVSQLNEIDVTADFMRDDDNWLIGKVKEGMTTLVQTFNFIAIGIKIFLLIVFSMISFPMNIFTSEVNFIVKIVGTTGYLYLLWFNIRALLHLYTFFKGSSQ